MTKRELIRCINYVDDELIIQANENNKYVNGWNRIVKICALMAACLLIVIGIETVENINITNQETTVPKDNLIKPLYLFEFNGYLYEIIINEQQAKQQGLPEKIEQSMVGELLEKNVFRDTDDNENLGDVYEYKEKADRSVVIVKDKMGKYRYALRCSPIDNTVY